MAPLRRFGLVAISFAILLMFQSVLVIPGSDNPLFGWLAEYGEASFWAGFVVWMMTCGVFIMGRHRQTGVWYFFRSFYVAAVLVAMNFLYIVPLFFYEIIALVGNCQVDSGLGPMNCVILGVDFGRDLYFWSANVGLLLTFAYPVLFLLLALTIMAMIWMTVDLFRASKSMDVEQLGRFERRNG